MKLDTNKLVEMATEFIFDRGRSIYIRRKHFSSPKAWTVRNEHGEYLTKALEFEPAAGRVVDSYFRSKTEFEFEIAYKLASAYVGKKIRENKEEKELEQIVSNPERQIRPAGTAPKVTNFDIYTNDDE